jgi:hypothetical protein
MSHLVLVIAEGLAGLALTVGAWPLSRKYNAYREHNSNINATPTPEGRSRNTKIMTVILLLAGVFLMLRSGLNLLTFIGAIR